MSSPGTEAIDDEGNADGQWPQTYPQGHYRHAWLIDRGTERRFGCWRCGHFYALPRETPGREAPRHPASETSPTYQRGLGFGCRFTSDAQVFVEAVVTYRTIGEMVRLARRWQEDPLTDVDRSYLTWAFGDEVYFVLGDESRIPTRALAAPIFPSHNSFPAQIAILPHLAPIY